MITAFVPVEDGKENKDLNLFGKSFEDWLNDEMRKLNIKPEQESREVKPKPQPVIPKAKEAEERREIIRKDNVDHPSHYTYGGIETIDFIEAKNLDFCLGNAVKYIARAGHKNDKIEDLKKAQWYIARELKTWENNSD